MEEINTEKDPINKLYIAYGSNLNLSQMKERCPTARVIGRSEIEDYELVFKGSSTNAVATIEPCEGSVVPVLIWDIKDEDEKALDRYEGYPNLYGKEEIKITLDDNPIPAMVYIMTPGHQYGNPSEFYLETIEKGYTDSGFNTDILYNAEEDKIKTVTGKDNWNTSVISRMLVNEKYMGDALLQKTYTVDFLTKKRVKNDGIVPQYYIEDNHEAIIPKELFYKAQEERARRTSLNKSAVTRKTNKMKKEKSKYSSKYAVTEILICEECGHPYRRQVWSKYGQKSAVWRCENRLKNGTKANCKHSPTLKEELLHDAIMKAINSVVEDTGDFIGAFRENVIRVIGGYTTKEIPTEYDENIELLQKEMLELIEENAKLGAMSEDFDDEYKRISEEINKLKEAKLRMVQEKKQADRYEERLDEMESTIKTVRPQVREFDEDLVRRLINTIRVNRRERLEIQFESGIVMEQMVDYYD